MLLSTIQQLPALTRLDVVYVGIASELHAPVSESHGLPRCEELAQLHSRSLTQLRVSMLGGPMDGNMLRLTDLPELRSCTLSGEPTLPLNLRVDAASFQGVPQLQNLDLHSDSALNLQHGCLAPLTALTALTLTKCGLQTVPAEVASLSRTLRVLDLSYNGRLQISDDAVSTILHCSRLTTLGLHKPDIEEWKNKLHGAVWQGVELHMAEEGYTPAQFSLESLSHLVQLPSAFRRRHHRNLTLLLTYREYDHCLCPCE